MTSFNRYSLFAVCLFSATAAMAQNPDDKPKVTEEIEVVRPYKPVLADAVKIRRSPDLENNAKFKAALSYQIPDRKLELTSGLSTLQAQPLSMLEIPAPPANLARIGVGNLNAALGELYVGTAKDEALQAGVFAKHISQQGDIEGQQFSNQQASVYGRSIMDRITLSGNVSYDGRSLRNYGVDPALAAPLPAPEKYRYNLFQAEGELVSNYSPDTASPFSLKGGFYLFGNNADSKENSAAISGAYSFMAGNFSVGINASADLTSYKSTTTSFNNNLLRANPYVQFFGKGFKLNLGLNLIQEFGTNSGLNVLPNAFAEAPISQGYAVLFAGVHGDVLKTSFKELSYQNPFLAEDNTISNAIEKMNIYGGVKGNAGSGFGYKVMAFSKKIENMPLFDNVAADHSRFRLIYDTGTSTVSGLSAEISLKASDKIGLAARLDFVDYKMDTENQAWYKPAVTVGGSANAKVTDKLSLNASILLASESKARFTDPASTAGPQVVTLKGYADLSAGADYAITNKIGVFVKVNNLLNTRYQQYLFYPKFGLNALGGLSYSF